MLSFLIMREGKRSSTKALTLACWLSTTIWYSILLIKEQLTAEYIGIYLGAFVFNQAFSTGANYYAKTRLESRPSAKVDNPDA